MKERLVVAIVPAHVMDALAIVGMRVPLLVCTLVIFMVDNSSLCNYLIKTNPTLYFHYDRH